VEPTAPPLGRRERNKQDKLERITAAARELFGAHGVDEVTTQQIADRADVGAGTVFLYAKSKAELLLHVQNLGYAEALERGLTAAAGKSGLDAVMAVVAPIVACNRVQVENGRTYLREIVFGDPAEPRHREALDISARTEAAIAAILARDSRIPAGDPDTLAHIVSAVMFLTMTLTANARLAEDEIVAQIRSQVAVLLPR